MLGGDANVDEEREHPWLRVEKGLIRALLDLRTPLLGVCLGAQLLAEVAGGAVGPLAGGDEIGWHEVTKTGVADPVFDPLPDTFRAFQWHGYGFALPPDAIELARGARGPQAFRIGNAYGVQFHAEVDAQTVSGWIRDYGPAAGVDTAALQAESDRELPQWNEIGRTLVSRFLQPPARPGADPR